MATTSERRDTLRIKLPPIDGIRIFIQDQSYELHNLSDNGFGLFIHAASHRFHLGQRLTDLQLEMEKERHPLNGAVAHVTRTMEGYVLGVRLETRSIAEYQLLDRLKAHCAQVLEEMGDTPT